MAWLIPLWTSFVSTGLALVLGVLAFLIYSARERAPSSPDPSERWASAHHLNPTPCYDNLSGTPTNNYECAHLKDGPIEKRPSDWRDAHVAVYSVKASPERSKLYDLSERGQAKAIEILERNVPSGDALTNLQLALSDSKPAGEQDPFRFDRVLVATVTKGLDWQPADRLMWARVFVKPINFRFAGYSIAATKNETLNIARFELTDSHKLSGGVAASLPGSEGPKASIDVSDEHSAKTTSDLSVQHQKLGIDIFPDLLRIIREADRNEGAAGNTRVSLTAVTDSKYIWKQFPEDRHYASRDGDDPVVLLVTDVDPPAKPGEGDKHGPAHAIKVLPQVRVPHCALRARVWMLYEERKVDDGDQRSYDEWKQHVTLLRAAEDKEDVDVVDADEVSPAIWSIGFCRSAECGQDGEKVRACVKHGDDLSYCNPHQLRKIVFSDYGVATRFTHLLKAKLDHVPSINSTFADYTLFGNLLNKGPPYIHSYTYPDNHYLFNIDSDVDEYSFVPTKASGDECNNQEADYAGGG